MNDANGKPCAINASEAYFVAMNHICGGYARHLLGKVRREKILILRGLSARRKRRIRMALRGRIRTQSVGERFYIQTKDGIES